MDVGGGAGDWSNAAVSTGTTIIAVSYDGGVILGADTRVTTGTYISNRASDKITALSDSVYLCRSGSAADTQAVSDYVRHFINQYEMEQGAPADVATVSNVVMQLNYNNKALLMAGMIVAGWDKWEGASVYAIPIGGTRLKVPFATGGSGSTYLFGFCDAEWRPAMTEAEAEAFVVKAVTLAMARDGGSGGCVRTVRVDKTGVVRKYHAGDRLELFYEEVPAKESLPATS